ncbi:Uncharacterized protein AC502_2000 [Pseudomonas syringae pv. maculicola]|nr:Uncharacterized protein AC502_2000 [Pseudomonas syringae pv. maculicola]
MVLHSDIGINIKQYTLVDSDSSASQALNNRVIDNRVGFISNQTSVRTPPSRAVSNIDAVQITHDVTTLGNKNISSRRKNTLTSPTLRRCPMQLRVNQIQLTPQTYCNTHFQSRYIARKNRGFGARFIRIYDSAQRDTET